MMIHLIVEVCHKNKSANISSTGKTEENIAEIIYDKLEKYSYMLLHFISRYS